MGARSGSLRMTDTGTLHRREGSARAREECQRTLAEAREAMGLTYFRDATTVQVGE